MRNKIVQNHIEGIVSVVVLLIVTCFILYLIWGNYLSQKDLSESIKKSFINSVEEQVLKISQCFRQMQEGVEQLSKSRELEIYYENKALGMSLEYGLKASILNIKSRFNAVMENQIIGTKHVFEKLAYVEREGNVLIDPGKIDKELDLFQIASKSSQAGDFLVLKNQNNFIYIVTPFYFKNEHRGQIVAKISTDVIKQNIDSNANKENILKKQLFLVYEDNILDAVLDLSDAQKNQINHFLSKTMNISTKHLIEIKTKNKKYKDVTDDGMLAYKTAIEDTPFELLAIISKHTLLGKHNPGNLLFVLGTITFFLILIVLFSFKMSLKNVALAIKIKEEKERVNLIEQKVGERTKELIGLNNMLLEEIEDRKKAENKLKQAQAQLVQSEKLASIGQLAAGIAHEINNPMGFIGSNIEIFRQFLSNNKKLLDQMQKIKKAINVKDIEKSHRLVSEMNEIENQINIDYFKEELPELIKDVQKGVDRVNKIVLDMKIFSREDTGEIDILNVNNVLDDIIRITWNKIKYNCVLKKHYGDIPCINGNQQKLGQVFMNLIINASQAIENKGRINIKTYAQDNNICIEISDNGKGIEEGNLKKIFDAFYTTKPVGEGTGLGLSISYEIIKKHGGDIIVESQVDKGTTFIISLPKEYGIK